MITGRWRALILGTVVALPLALSGCFVVQAHAPYGPDVKLLPRDVPVEVTRRYQKWYAIWGLFAISANDPRVIIQQEQLVEARVYTEDSVEDVLSGIAYTLLFPAGIILPQTVVVEGNRVPLDERGVAEGEPESGEESSD